MHSDTIEKLGLRILDLERRLKVFTNYALAHQAWEAQVLLDESPWFDEMDDDLMVGFEKLQTLRNEALGV